MTLMRWKPFGDLVSMQGRINRLFDDDKGSCHTALMKTL